MLCGTGVAVTHALLISCGALGWMCHMLCLSKQKLKSSEGWGRWRRKKVWGNWVLRVASPDQARWRSSVSTAVPVIATTCVEEEFQRIFRKGQTKKNGWKYYYYSLAFVLKQRNQTHCPLGYILAPSPPTTSSQPLLSPWLLFALWDLT